NCNLTIYGALKSEGNSNCNLTMYGALKSVDNSNCSLTIYGSLKSEGSNCSLIIYGALKIYVTNLHVLLLIIIYISMGKFVSWHGGESMKKSYWGISLDELYLFNCGLSHHSYRFMGAHPMSWNGQQGVRFAVWAPEARQVAIVTDEIGWDTEGIPLTRVGSTGIHIGFMEGMQQGTRYKYRILTANGDVLLKSDPYAFYSERRPNTASIVYGLNDFEWSDQAWYEKLQQAPSYQQPLLIYEAHAGSWRI